MDLFTLVGEGSRLAVNAKWLGHLAERQLGEDGHPRKVGCFMLQYKCQYAPVQVQNTTVSCQKHGTQVLLNVFCQHLMGTTPRSCLV